MRNSLSTGRQRRGSAVVASLGGSNGNNRSGSHSNARVCDQRGGEVLVPSLVQVLAALDAPEDASLDEIGIRVPINSDPSSTAILSARAATRWHGGLGDREGTGDLSNAGCCEGGAGPVRRFHIGSAVDVVGGAGLELVGATNSTSGAESIHSSLLAGGKRSCHGGTGHQKEVCGKSEGLHLEKLLDCDEKVFERP